MPHDLLDRRADDYRRQILDVAKGPGGMIISFLPYSTRSPFQEGQEYPRYISELFEDGWGGVSPRPTMAERYYGENTLWATGWLLHSQILRYRSTGEPEALATARKCFRDLNNIFRMCHELEPGLLGKPHGGRAGPTTSYDQSACPILFYAAFAREFGTPAERVEAETNLGRHGEYYLRRNWVMNVHGNLQRILDFDPITNTARTSAMKYIACVYAAFQTTGEERFRDAAVTEMRRLIRSGALPFPSARFEMSHNLYYWALLCDYWRTTELGAEADWDAFIGEYWIAAQASLDEEHLFRFGTYDVPSRAFEPHPDRWLTADDRAEFPVFAPRRVPRKWVSATAMFNRSLNTAMTAALGLLARSRGLDDGAHEVARRILLRMDADTLRWWWDDGKLPVELQPLLDVFVPEVPAVWLTAHAMGQEQGVW